MAAGREPGRPAPPPSPRADCAAGLHASAPPEFGAGARGPQGAIKTSTDRYDTRLAAAAVRHADPLSPLAGRAGVRGSTNRDLSAWSLDGSHELRVRPLMGWRLLLPLTPPSPRRHRIIVARSHL